MATLRRPFLGIGWKFPLQVTPTGAIATSSEEQRIEESILLILSTAPGERLMLPGMAWAGSSTDAALGLGAFAALGTLLLGAAVLSQPAVAAPAPVVVEPPAPPVVYAPPPPVVYPPPPPVAYAPPPPVIYAPAPPVVGRPCADRPGWPL